MSARTHEENLKTAEWLERMRAATKFVCGDQWEEIIAQAMASADEKTTPKEPTL